MTDNFAQQIATFARQKNEIGLKSFLLNHFISVNIVDKNSEAAISILAKEKNESAVQFLIEKFNASPHLAAEIYGKYGYVDLLKKLIAQYPAIKDIIKKAALRNLTFFDLAAANELINEESDPLKRFQLQKASVYGLAKNNLTELDRLITANGIFKPILEEATASAFAELDNEQESIYFDRLKILINKNNGTWKKRIIEQASTGYGRSGNLNKIKKFLDHLSSLNILTATPGSIIPFICFGLAEASHSTALQQFLTLLDINEKISKEPSLVFKNKLHIIKGMALTGHAPSKEFLENPQENVLLSYQVLWLGSAMGNHIPDKEMLLHNMPSVYQLTFLQSLYEGLTQIADFTLIEEMYSRDSKIYEKDILIKAILIGLAKGERSEKIQAFLNSHEPCQTKRLEYAKFIAEWMGSSRELTYFFLPTLSLTEKCCFMRRLGKVPSVLEFRNLMQSQKNNEEIKYFCTSFVEGFKQNAAYLENKIASTTYLLRELRHRKTALLYGHVKKNILAGLTIVEQWEIGKQLGLDNSQFFKISILTPPKKRRFDEIITSPHMS